MSPLELYNTRARATPTFVPADPSGRVGLFVCGPTVNDLPHLGHAKTYPSSTSSSASRGPAASPSRTCRTSPTWTTRSSAGRASSSWRAKVAVDAVLVGERLDGVQALGRPPPRPDVHVAARVGPAHHGLTDRRDCDVFVRERCCRQRRIAGVRP